MLDFKQLQNLPDDVLLHLFMGACFLYSYNHNDKTRSDMYQMKAEIIRRMNN